jgi:hypothetical protein
MNADKNFGADGGLDGCGRRYRAICVHLRSSAAKNSCLGRQHHTPRPPPAQAPTQSATATPATGQADGRPPPPRHDHTTPAQRPPQPERQTIADKTPYTLARWRPPTGPTSATDAGREKPTPPPVDRRTAARPTAPREISAETPCTLHAAAPPTGPTSAANHHHEQHPPPLWTAAQQPARPRRAKSPQRPHTPLHGGAPNRPSRRSGQRPRPTLPTAHPTAPVPRWWRRRQTRRSGDRTSPTRTQQPRSAQRRPAPPPQKRSRPQPPHAPSHGAPAAAATAPPAAEPRSTA